MKYSLRKKSSGGPQVSEIESSLSLRTAAASTKSAGRRAILTNLDASCSDSVTFWYISQFLEARTLKVALPSEVSPSFLEPKGILRHKLAYTCAVCEGVREKDSFLSYNIYNAISHCNVFFSKAQFDIFFSRHCVATPAFQPCTGTRSIPQ